MHLSIFNIFKSLFNRGYLKEQAKYHSDHTYIKGPVEARGPCPGLNALANMGYL